MTEAIRCAQMKQRSLESMMGGEMICHTDNLLSAGEIEVTW